ncbi:4204_t:CDS:1, partial [Dentiscutata heterogama]
IFELTFFWITHAIKRYVKFGHDIDSGENIERVIKNIAGMHIAYLEPNINQ